MQKLRIHLAWDAFSHFLHLTGSTLSSSDRVSSFAIWVGFLSAASVISSQYINIYMCVYSFSRRVHVVEVSGTSIASVVVLLLQWVSAQACTGSPSTCAGAGVFADIIASTASLCCVLPCLIQRSNIPSVSSIAAIRLTGRCQ